MNKKTILDSLLVIEGMVLFGLCSFVVGYLYGADLNNDNIVRMLAGVIFIFGVSGISIFYGMVGIIKHNTQWVYGVN